MHAAQHIFIVETPNCLVFGGVSSHYRLPPLGGSPECRLGSRQERGSLAPPPKTHAGGVPTKLVRPRGSVTAGSRAGTWHYGEPIPKSRGSTCPATEGRVTLAGGCRSREQLGLTQHTPHPGVQGHPAMSGSSNQ